MENDATKHHRKALNHVIQAAEEAVEYTKITNLLRQEVIDAENELAKAVQAKNSHYRVQKVGLNAEACITSQTMRLVEDPPVTILHVHTVASKYTALLSIMIGI